MHRRLLGLGIRARVVELLQADALHAVVDGLSAAVDTGRIVGGCLGRAQPRLGLPDLLATRAVVQLVHRALLRGNLGLRLLQGELRLRSVESRQYLPRLDRIALLDENVCDAVTLPEGERDLPEVDIARKRQLPARRKARLLLVALVRIKRAAQHGDDQQNRCHLLWLPYLHRPFPHFSHYTIQILISTISCIISNPNLNYNPCSKKEPLAGPSMVIHQIESGIWGNWGNYFVSMMASGPRSPVRMRTASVSS